MRIEVNGVRLFLDIEGQKLVPDGPVMREKPTLILLHGGPGMDGAYWRPEFSTLADVAQVIYLDQRGCGRSDRGPQDGWTLAQWGDDVRAFCDALEIQSPIVCGSSFGGEVAMSYATRHPDHPSKLILLSCNARLNVDRIAEAFRRLGGDEIADIARSFWSDFNIERGMAYMERCIPLYFRSPPDPDHDARSIVNGDLTLDYLKNGGEAQRADFREALARIECPTLVMGGEDDPVVPIEDMAELASLIPPHLVKYEPIPNCGHGPFFDAPDRTIEAIRNFIAA